VRSSSWRSLAIGDDAFLRGSADAGALGNATGTTGVSIPVVLVTAIHSVSVGGQPGGSPAVGVGSSGAADGADDEPIVQTLSRLLAIDKGEAMSGVEADEEIGTCPD
jgi:hypothetical protein